MVPSAAASANVACCNSDAVAGIEDDVGGVKNAGRPLIVDAAPPPPLVSSSVRTRLAGGEGFSILASVAISPAKPEPVPIKSEVGPIFP